MYEENALVPQEQPQQEIVEVSPDTIFLMAEQAEKTIAALNKIMQAALQITTEKDWVVISGSPYLQESGATKVRALFGISWQINNSPDVESHTDGHRTYTYHGTFSFRGSQIDAEGSRSSKDDFFSKLKGGNTRSVDEIDMKNVRKAAYTNCINNGMKRILPGLRNIDIEALKAAGMDLNKIKGFSHGSGSKGGAGQQGPAGTCEDCGAEINHSVKSFSESKFGKPLCMNCQKKGQS